MTNVLSTISNFSNKIVARIESEEKGQGMVEMAFVLCFLLCLTFGIIDMGRCIYTNNMVSAAAQEGARAGIVDVDDIRTAVESKMVGLDIDSAVITITVNGDIVEVEVAYDFEFITPMADSIVSSLALNGKASMVTM